MSSGSRALAPSDISPGTLQPPDLFPQSPAAPAAPAAPATPDLFQQNAQSPAAPAAPQQEAQTAQSPAVPNRQSTRAKPKPKPLQSAKKSAQCERTAHTAHAEPKQPPEPQTADTAEPTETERKNYPWNDRAAGTIKPTAKVHACSRILSHTFASLQLPFQLISICHSTPSGRLRAFALTLAYSCCIFLALRSALTFDAFRIHNGNVCYYI